MPLPNVPSGQGPWAGGPRHGGSTGASDVATVAERARTRGLSGRLPPCGVLLPIGV